ncbi:MAG: hypothetical protein SF053_01955 [Bacteroidia bacterium]|nr:hypothetical protein [Bacteroidia bacterium]
MYRFFSLLLWGAMCLVITPMAAQSYKKYHDSLHDVVYLHNGWIIRGTITARTDSTLSIETEGRNLFVFRHAEVKQVMQEFDLAFGRDKHARRYVTAPEQRRIGTRGYYGYLQVNFLTGNGSGGVETSQYLATAHGYQFKRWLSAGLGAGLSAYARGPMMPFFAEVRSDLGKGVVTPHIAIQGGYSLPLYGSNTANGGNLIKAYGGTVQAFQAGVRIYSYTRLSWLITGGYMIQQDKNDFRYWWGENTIQEIYTYRRLTFGVTMMF